jgi:hypothetical protein
MTDEANAVSELRSGLIANLQTCRASNLACFRALGGRLGTARALLRLALPADDQFRTLAPTDDDLLALRNEIPSLIGT